MKNDNRLIVSHDAEWFYKEEIIKKTRCNKTTILLTVIVMILIIGVWT